MVCHQVSGHTAVKAGVHQECVPQNTNRLVDSGHVHNVLPTGNTPHLAHHRTPASVLSFFTGRVVLVNLQKSGKAFRCFMDPVQDRLDKGGEAQR